MIRRRKATAGGPVRPPVPRGSGAEGGRRGTVTGLRKADRPGAPGVLGSWPPTLPAKKTYIQLKIHRENPTRRIFTITLFLSPRFLFIQTSDH